MRKLYLIPYIISLVASHIMCVVVAYNYASLLYCEGCSAPASAAFLILIPFCVFIVICVVVGYLLKKKYIKNAKLEK